MTVRSALYWHAHQLHQFINFNSVVYLPLLVFLIFVGESFTTLGSTPPEEFYKDLVTNSCRVDSFFTVKDDKFLTSQWSTIERNVLVRDAVVFDLNDDTTFIYPYPFTCTINAKIVWWDSSNTSHMMNKTLSIAYDTGRVKTYAARDVFYLKNAHMMKVTITSLTFVQSGWNGVLPKTLRLSGLISIDRKYKYKCTKRTAPKSQVQANNTTKISWKAIDGAEEYDLEWTFYHDSSAIIKHYMHAPNSLYSNYDSLYRNNSTRITTAQNVYYIPLDYPTGFLFFRVRSAHYTVDGFRKTGQWSGQDTANVKFSLYPYKTHLSGMDAAINWQSKVTFAEEGKRSPVVTYFDGSLRNRQTLTISDAVSRAIIGETFYDHQGRASIQTLPVPATDALLGFHDLFNKSAQFTSKEYGRNDFDTLACGFSPYPMDSSIGSSYYYSKSNSDNNKAIQKWLPAADGYPFTVKRYTPDLTGRLAMEGGAGKELRFGNGHETKYYYGKPAQEELDRIFGNDAGFDSLYFKNMVVDPNGQVSVSYLDGSGHTIATALAGDAPSNLEALPSNTGSTNITIDLLNGNAKVDGGFNMDYSLPVEKSGTHTFTYSLVPPSLTPECSDNSNICFDCLYDLTITITDVCNNTSFQHVLHNYSIGAIYDSLCSNPAASITDNFSLSLSVGEYHISKRLTVSDAGRTQYTNSYMYHDDCLRSYDDFLDDATANIDFAGCYMNCQDCLNGIGTSSNFLHNYIINLGYSPAHQDTLDANALYQKAAQNCVALCDTSFNECDVIYQQLLNDVKPGGQYAKYKYDANSGQFIAGDTSLLNQFDKSYFNNLDYTSVIYRDEFGVPDTVSIDGVKYLPSQLSVDLFVKNWKDSWASALLPLHPEYCYYSFYCIANPTILPYATDMMNVSTFIEAEGKGYLNPLGKTNFTTLNTHLFTTGSPNPEYFGYSLLDPLFTGIGSSFSNQMNDSMHYVMFGGTKRLLTDWEAASKFAICSTCDTSHLPYFTDSCIADRDMAWTAFRGIYLGERKQFVDTVFKIQNGSCFSKMLDIGKTGIFKNMTRRVYFYRDLISLTSNPTTTANNMISQCQSNCVALADNWISILQTSCTLTSLQITNIRAGFIEVCQAGCDNQHPFGESSLPSGVTSTPHNYKSFQDVLDQILGVNVCDASVIGYPPGYDEPSQDQQAFYGDNDTCSCKRLNAIRTLLFIPDSIASPKTFAQFLADNYESDLTQTEVYQIIGVCNGTCSWLSSPINIPPKLSCSNCVRCWRALQDYGYLITFISPTDTNSLRKQFNLLYGFNLWYANYWNLIDHCRQNNANYDTISYQICKEVAPTIYSSDTITCFDQLMNTAKSIAGDNYSHYIDSIKTNLWDQYIQHCTESLNETFTVQKPFNEYHFTLYYYDQAGNLVQTVPPKGVKLLTTTSALDSVKNHRLNPGTYPAIKIPNDSLKTRYWYNTFNKPIKQWTPDGDTTRFWYDRLGRIVASQNGRQRPNQQYSYSKYDALGRIVEVGQLKQTTALTFATALNDASLASWMSGGTNKKEVVHTYYEKPAFSIPNLIQENLRNRVSASTFMQTFNSDSTQYDFATHYSYDIAGNVKTLTQENKKLTSNKNRYKRIDYDYDLISGKVNKVFYEKDSLDQFTHWYIYDEDNRLIVAKTTTDNLLHYAAMDGNYLYYKHGPVGRIEIGTRQVQGTDYAYTLQGWIKGVNSDLQTCFYDMGQDGLNTAHRFFGKDAVGFSLSHFDKDYRPIGSSKFEMGVGATGGFGVSSPSLFNGNIRRAVYALRKLADSTMGYSYKYDQLNRLTKMDAWNNYTTGSFAWDNSGSGLSKFRERITYDPNGNILSYIRRGDNPVPMDSFTYLYDVGTNQLDHIDDKTSYSSNYPNDIDDQSSNNYLYDATGNLIKDNAEEISAIKWTVAGKIDTIARSAGSIKDKIKFYYDASGNRVGKIDYKNSGAIVKTWYVRDARGNIMATYIQSHDTIIWAEQEIYGSARLGNWVPNKRIYPGVSLMTTDTFHLKFYAGDKRYELSNHLGNIMAVITDRKIGIDTNSNGKADYYLADLTTIRDYYPFGFGMYNRSLNFDLNTSYRFGFNGMESDGEIKGSNNSIAFGNRIYDPRLGRFLTIDEYAKKYPTQSNYIFASDMPISAIDINGDSTYLILYGAGYLNYTMKGSIHDLGQTWKLQAKALEQQIRSSPEFDPKEDDVVVFFTPSTVQFATATNLKYSSGAIKSLIVFSHGYPGGIALGGRAPDDPGCDESIAEGDFINYNRREINTTTMGLIDFDNFGRTATCTFYGCNIGGQYSPESEERVDNAESSFAQAFANKSNLKIRAFTGFSESPSTNGQLQFTGRMIRSVDRASQKTVLTVFQKDKTPQPLPAVTR